jgi:hypothetical protein
MEFTYASRSALWWLETVALGCRAWTVGVQIARFPDTRERIARPPPKPSFRAIERISVPSNYRDQGSGRDSVFVREYRVARTGEASEYAVPSRADNWQDHGKSECINLGQELTNYREIRPNQAPSPLTCSTDCPTLPKRVISTPYHLRDIPHEQKNSALERRRLQP